MAAPRPITRGSQPPHLAHAGLIASYLLLLLALIPCNLSAEETPPQSIVEVPADHPDGPDLILRNQIVVRFTPETAALLHAQRLARSQTKPAQWLAPDRAKLAGELRPFPPDVLALRPYVSGADRARRALRKNAALHNALQAGQRLNDAQQKQAAKLIQAESEPHGPLEMFYAKLQDDVSPHQASETLTRRDDVVYACPSRVYRVHAAPNDPFYQRMWNLDTIGASAAWDNSSNTPNTQDPVYVGVIDTGVRITHREFDGPPWRIHAPHDANPDNGDAYGDADPDNDDPQGHGTSCAGIIAATRDNGLLVAGIAPVKIIPINCAELYWGSWGYIINYTEGATMAIEHGADVLNFSFGGVRNAPWQNELTLAAWAEIRGVVVCASAGNDGHSTANVYPAAIEYYLCVSAVDQDRARVKTPKWWWASNYGAEVDVCAPGQGNVSANGDSIIALHRLSDISYRNDFNGASAATPHVAGLCALLKHVNPMLTATEIRGIVENTATDLVGVSDEDTTGWDPHHGHGLINAAAAIEEALGLLGHTISGFIKTADGQPMPGVTITAPGARSPAMTNALGYYALSVPDAWSGAVVPTKAFTTFSPPSRSFQDVSADMPGVNFTVNQSAFFVVTNPNAGQFWQTGETYPLTWRTYGSTGNSVGIELYRNGTLLRQISAATANDGLFSWTLPADLPPGNDYRINISSLDNPAIVDDSDLPFRVAAAQPDGERLLYLDFDAADDRLYGIGSTYQPDPERETSRSVQGIHTEIYNSDGPRLETPAGDGVNTPATPGPQGGKALLLDGGGKEEGFNIELAQPFPVGDFTAEVCFWAATNNIEGNLYGLQDILNCTWPGTLGARFAIRVVGDLTDVGRPYDAYRLELATWQSDDIEKRITAPEPLRPQTWHTAQAVFDYNGDNPSSCVFRFYLDGQFLGAIEYNATAGGHLQHGMGTWSLPRYGARAGHPAWRFLLGCSVGRLLDEAGGNIRGLAGAIDALALSAGALEAEQFVLPAPPADPTPLIYLDFNSQPDTTLASGQLYTPHPGAERAFGIEGIYAEVTSGDGPTIAFPAGDGITQPAQPGPQGGKVLQLDSGGMEEGLNFEMQRPYPVGDYTIEVAFWPATTDSVGNLFGIQNIVDATWPGRDAPRLTLRIWGNARDYDPEDERTHFLELVARLGDETKVSILSQQELIPQTWHTVQAVLDYNPDNPPNSSIRLYLDGALQGSAPYNLWLNGPPQSGWGVLGQPTYGARAGVEAWRFCLGHSTDWLLHAVGNIRGLDGAIDAFVITPRALAPGQFILDPPLDYATSYNCFATSLHRDLLGREPTPLELDAALTALDANRDGAAGAARRLLDETEFADYPGLIIRAYAAMLNDNSRITHRAPGYRLPVRSEVEHWLGAMRASTDTASAQALLVDALANGPEWQARTQGLSTGEYVDLVYASILGRPADPAGRAQAIDHLTSGAVTSNSLVLNFLRSPEARDKYRLVEILASAELRLRQTEIDRARFSPLLVDLGAGYYSLDDVLWIYLECLPEYAALVTAQGCQFPRANKFAVSFGATQSQVGENGGLQKIPLTIAPANLAAPYTAAVEFAAAGGKASPGQDYRLPPGKVLFYPGQTENTFDLEILDDDLPELGETARLTLIPGQNERGVSAPVIIWPHREHVITILSDDPFPEIPAAVPPHRAWHLYP